MTLISSARAISIPVGIIVERSSPEGDWGVDRWRAVGVLLDPPPLKPALRLVSNGQSNRHHAATLPLLLDCGKSMDYQINLANGEPSVYVVMSEALRHASETLASIRLISASPFEVQPYRDRGDVAVDRVTMPARLVGLVRDVIGLGGPKPSSVA